VVTNAFPEDPVMQVLLPALLAMPVILTIFFYVLVLVCPCTTSKVTSIVSIRIVTIQQGARSRWQLRRHKASLTVA
jgi:hypothetical protein